MKGADIMSENNNDEKYYTEENQTEDMFKNKENANNNENYVYENIYVSSNSENNDINKFYNNEKLHQINESSDDKHYYNKQKNFESSYPEIPHGSFYDSNKEAYYNNHIPHEHYYSRYNKLENGNRKNFVKGETNKIDKGLKTFITICSGATIILVLFLFASMGGTYISENFSYLFSPKDSSKSSMTGTPNIALETVDHTEIEGTLTAQQVYAKRAPSIVGVLAYNSRQGLASTAISQGSGIIMRKDGYIITNAHVIGNSNKYSVTIVTDDKKEYVAKIVGFDVRTDLAVLKIDANNLDAAEFGNSDNCK